MAPRSVARRVAESYLAELLEDEHLPHVGVLMPDGSFELPTDEIIERLLDIGAVKIERKRTREYGEVIVLTFAVEGGDA